MHDYFYCYSYRLMYFIKSCGIDYEKYDFNKNNGLKYFMFERSEKLNNVLDKWNDLKSKEDKE